MNRRVGKDVSECDKLVRSERGRCLFWHWMWQESGKPQNGVVYSGKKRTIGINIIMRCVAVKTKFRISKAKHCRKYFGQQQILERGKKRLLVKLSQIVLTRQMVLKKFLMYFMKNTECYTIAFRLMYMSWMIFIIL